MKVTYPTGLQVNRWQYYNNNGTLRIDVEEILVAPAGSIGVSKGDVEVSGSIIPLGAKGVICHETLPVRTFRGPKAVSKARSLARRWFKKLQTEAA